jgi:hypothetical protein
MVIEGADGWPVDALLLSYAGDFLDSADTDAQAIPDLTNG